MTKPLYEKVLNDERLQDVPILHIIKVLDIIALIESEENERIEQS